MTFLSPAVAVKRIFGEASEKNLYLSQLVILDTLEKCLAGVSLPSDARRSLSSLMWRLRRCRRRAFGMTV